MLILTAVRKVLQDDSNVAGAATGGIHMVDVPQDSARPNLMLMLVDGSDEWTHDGPDGLNQDRVRIYSRGDTFEQAVTLADAVRTALNGYAGTRYSIGIKLAQHINRTGDYQDGAKVYRQIDDYRITYRTDGN